MRASFGTNVLKLLTSKIAAQTIAFITAPIIARIFLPEHFGVIQLFLSINGVIIVISCLRYEYTIPLGRSKNEAVASVIIGIISSLGISLVSLILVFMLKDKVAIWLKSPELKTFLWYLPLTIFLGGVSHIANYYASRLGMFGTVAWSSFVLTSGNALIPIVFGLIFGASAMFLFVGNLAGITLSILTISIFIFREFLSDIRNMDLSPKYIWKVAKYYKKFPVYDVWGALFNSISIQLPPIIMGAYFSKTVVGYYSLGNRFIGLPISLLGNSISQVFFPSVAKKYNEEGKLAKIVSNTSKRLIQIGVFPFMILGFFGGPLFSFVFGENWTEAGVYTQILSIYVLFRFISTPLSTLFSVFNRQGTLLFLTLGQLVIRTLALIIFARFGNPRNCLIAFSFASSIFYILIFYFAYRFSKVSLGIGIKVSVKYLILSLILLLPVLFLTKIITNIYFLLIALIIDAFLYLFILCCFDLEIRNVMRKISGKLLATKS